MTAKEYLDQAKFYEIKIQRYCDELNELEAMKGAIHSPDITGVRVQTSPNPDRIVNTLIKIEEKQEKIAGLIEQEFDFKMKITDEIHDLDNPQFISILYLRYVKRLSWNEIGKAMDRNVRYVQHLNGQALNEFYEIHHERLHLTK